jgi:hypothetical protein
MLGWKKKFHSDNVEKKLLSLWGLCQRFVEVMVVNKIF